MTPKEFMQIVAQNPKLSVEFVNDVMTECGWTLMPCDDGISFTDGERCYHQTIVRASPNERRVYAPYVPKNDAPPRRRLIDLPF